MPQFTKAIVARGRGERVRLERRRQETKEVGRQVDFRAGIMASLKDVRCLLDQQGVTSVSVIVDEAHLPLFNESLYSHELAGYEITQDPAQPNKFKISDKVLF